jgi:phage terminase small subunit
MLNEKQEKFAQSYIIHRNATEAAKAAGYSDRSAANQGYRLINNPEIAERIEDLEKELETNIDVVDEIENQYTFAKANGHTNSAIKALELLSRIRGSKGDTEKELDKKELKEEIVKFMEIIGKDEVEEILKTCVFD